MAAIGATKTYPKRGYALGVVSPDFYDWSGQGCRGMGMTAHSPAR
jgi:hypothetical protein